MLGTLTEMCPQLTFQNCNVLDYKLKTLQTKHCRILEGREILCRQNQNHEKVSTEKYVNTDVPLLIFIENTKYFNVLILLWFEVLNSSCVRSKNKTPLNPDSRILKMIVFFTRMWRLFFEIIDVLLKCQLSLQKLIKKSYILIKI